MYCNNVAHVYDTACKTELPLKFTVVFGQNHLTEGNHILLIHQNLQSTRRRNLRVLGHRAFINKLH